MANLSNINGKFVVEQTTGFVGIGTTDPAFLIEAAGTNAELALNASSIYRIRSTASDEFIITKNGVGDRLTIAGGGNATFSGEITSGDDINAGGKVVLNNVGADRKIQFIRTSAKTWSIEQDASQIYFYNVTDAKDVLLMKNAGQIMIGEYGSGNFTGTTAYTLAVDSSGNIIETTDGGGDITGSGTTNKVAKFTGAKAIGDGPITFATNDSTFAGNFHTLGRAAVGTTPHSTIKLDVLSTATDWAARIKNYTNSGYGLAVDCSGAASSTTYTLAAYSAAGGGLFVRNDDKVGIGTTSPTTLLNTLVTANSENMTLGSAANMGFKVGNTTGNEYGICMGVGNSGRGWIQVGRTDGTATAYDLTLQSSGGNVGIGTTSPAAKLHVSGDTGGADSIARFQNTNSAKVTRLQLLDSAGTVGDALIAYDHSNASSALHYLGMGVNNSTTLIINNNDDVGIGVTSPSARLHINYAANPTELRIGSNTTDDCWVMFNTDGNDWSVGTDRSDSNKFKISDYSTLGTNDRLVIDTSGNATFAGDVTISRTGGNDAKLNLLTDGAGGSESLIYFSDTTDGAGRIRYDHNDGSPDEMSFYTASTKRVVINSAGNVGIGTDSPATKLQVVYAGEVIVRTSMTAADGYRGGFEADNQHTGGTIWSMFSTNDSDGYFGGGKFVIANESMGGVDVNTPSKFVIDGAGSVLIGDGIPSGTPEADYRSLEIGRQGNTITGAPWKSNLYLTCNATITGGSSAFTYRYASEAPARMDLEDGIIRFYNAAAGTAGNTISWSERMRITSAGDIGIGSTSPSSYNSRGQDLVIKKTGSDVGISIVAEASGGTDYSSSIMFADGTGGTAGYRGIIEYDHADDSMAFSTAATVHGKINSSGSLTMSGDVIAYGSPSDKRLKENIKPIKSALDKVSKLQGVTFNWKKSDSILDIKEDIGFIAQDVQKIIPELVRKNEDGMLSMRHQGIAPILLEAIKELKAEIEELKSNKCNCNK